MNLMSSCWFNIVVSGQDPPSSSFAVQIVQPLFEAVIRKCKTFCFLKFAHTTWPLASEAFDIFRPSPAVR